MTIDFEVMEKCFVFDAEWENRVKIAAESDNYFIRYSAAVSIGKYGNETHFQILEKLLDREEKEPIYGQCANLKNTDADAGDNKVGDIGFPEGTTDYEKQAWQRRGKIKQAVCLAVSEIYRGHKNTPIEETLLLKLHKYATDQTEDYCVRAAAVKAIGIIGKEESKDVLIKAEQDPEWCTKTEAKKALNNMPQTEAFSEFVYDEEVNNNPFYIDNTELLRNKVLNTDNEFITALWNGIKNKTAENSGRFPWFEAFKAMITNDKSDYRTALEGIRSYVKSLKNLRYNPGVHFHSWCFALPHARWTLYLQWMYALKAVSKKEAAALMKELVAHHFMYYYSCYRVKPSPETVDNQTLSLAISSALIGYIAGNPPFNSNIARVMFSETIQRVDLILEKMGEECYSGEGSTYMNHVIASCIPLGCELLERIYKKDYFEKCRSVSEMMALEIMPDSLALPWDHYGYILPTLQCLSYNSKRIDAVKYSKLLKEYTDYSFSIITGWGFDDPVWTLIWYTEEKGDCKAFESWYREDIAACLVSDDMNFAAVQMFDSGKAEHIARFHCNPNALILSAYGSPLLTEGVPEKGCERFKYKDTEKTFGFMSIEAITVNDGYGCAGAHSVVLVDNYEAMMPHDDTKQTAYVEFDKENKSIYADVTPIYKQSFPDAELVARKTTLMLERCFLVEDTVRFSHEHDFTMRMIVRSKAREENDCIITSTPEGTGMRMIELDGGGKITLEKVDGYPNTLDKRSVIVDNTKHGKEVTWRYLIIPYDLKEEYEDITDNWYYLADDEKKYSFSQAITLIRQNKETVPIKAPVQFLGKAENAEKHWYYRTFRNPGEDFLLRLPRNMHNAELWLNGEKYNIENTSLLPLYVPVKNSAVKEVEILLSVETGTSQYKGKYNGGGFFGKAVVYRLR